jgi:hypothetical protein
MAAPAPQPVPAPAPAYAYHAPWFLFRLLSLVAAVCGIIAAFEFSGILHGGMSMGWAWLAGAFASWFLGWAIP